MSEPRLTYCGNVHAAENLDAWLDGVERFSAPVAAAQPKPLGLGAWWNYQTATALAEDEARRQDVAARLEELGLEVWTLNVFPFGDFHGKRVKEDVYQPDWTDQLRSGYTLAAASAVAALVDAGTTIPLSTLPVGYGAVDLSAAARALSACALDLAALEDSTGVRCVLALEPEPFCVLETVAGTAAFLEEHVFAAKGGRDEALVRRHLGVCVDLCHLAVVGEEPLAALADLAARGIEVPKIQVSSCLELRRPAELERLLAFDEARYLHQTVADTGARALDLPEVRARSAEFMAAGLLRTHFHMPIFWEGDEVLGSSRREVQRVLGALPDPAPLLEVETYTWSVLDRDVVGSGDLVAGLCQELAFARSALPA